MTSAAGVAWSYSPEETDYSEVDAIEIATGPQGSRLPPLDPGPNPFTPLAIFFWESALAGGDQIAAVGLQRFAPGRGGRRRPPRHHRCTDRQATTVVKADELSENAIQRGVEAGHTYVKLFGNDGPDLRFEATAPGLAPAIMGDTLKASAAQFTAQVLGAGASAARPGLYLLLVVKDGIPLLAEPGHRRRLRASPSPASAPAATGCS